MITELVLLLGLFAFITGPVFFGEKGPFKVFQKSGPRLAARIERHVSVGREFKVKGGNYNQWLPPEQAPPDGKF